jgi:hypothetical protein
LISAATFIYYLLAFGLAYYWLQAQIAGWGPKAQ